MATSALDLDALKTHVGRKQAASDVLHPGPANLLRLALGRPEPELRDGDPLPPAWLALYFLPRFATADLRPDGSPRDAGVVPPMPLPRRMFAGERVRFHRPLRLGESVRRETTLADLSMKSGGTGPLVFATVTSRVLGADGVVAIEDERRTVFREEVKAGERNQAPKREPAPSDVPWRTHITPDAVLLFRFSALGHGGDALRGRAGVGESKRQRNAAMSSSNATIWPPRVEDGTRMTVRTPVARHASTPSRTSLALPNSVTSVSHRSDMVAMSSRV